MSKMDETTRSMYISFLLHTPTHHVFPISYYLIPHFHSRQRSRGSCVLRIYTRSTHLRVVGSGAGGPDSGLGLSCLLLFRKQHRINVYSGEAFRGDEEAGVESDWSDWLKRRACS